MSGPPKTEGKVFRPSAGRLFICFVGLGVPIYAALIAWRHGSQIPWKPFFTGMASFVPTSIIGAGLVKLAYPVRLTTDGIHSQSIWGLPCFMRWQDIKTARRFRFFNLPWLRIYPKEKGTVMWMPLFQSARDQFKQEMQRLAPPDSPVLGQLE